MNNDPNIDMFLTSIIKPVQLLKLLYDFRSLDFEYGIQVIWPTFMTLCIGHFAVPLKVKS